MSNLVSGGISFSGIGSGTDFEAMIEQLREVESMKVYTLDDSRTEAKEQYDAMTELIDTVREAQEALEALNSPSKFLTKVASSSDESILSAKADSDAVDGTHTIDIKQLASNAIWANANSYDSKTTVINSTGSAIEFSYSYDGQTRTLSVPPGTTLEGFANMVNQDKANLGVKISLLQTADGYTFQMSGKDSGKDASLTIHPSELMHMGAEGSTWQSNSAVDLSTAFNANEPALTTNNEFWTILQDGTNIHVDGLSGDTTQQELVDAINLEYRTNHGGTTDIASLVDNKLSIENLAYMGTTDENTTGTKDVYTNKPTSSVTLTGDLSTSLGAEGTTTTYTFTDYKDQPVTVEIEGVHKQTDILTKLGQMGYTANGSIAEDKSSTDITISGLKDISALTATDSSGTPPTATLTWPTSTFTATVPSADTPIQAGVLPDTLTFDFTMGDGTTQSITVNKGQNMADVYSALNTAVPGTVEGDLAAASSNITLNNVSSMTSTPAGLLPSGRITGSDAWAVQEAQDAEFYIDNWPQLLTSSTNEVTGVLEGVTLTLKDEAEVQITIASDTESVKANIQTFLDSINSVIKKVQDLTAVTTEPADSYSEEGVGSTTSGPLTGDYSINLFTSRLSNEMTGHPPGFQPINGNDLFSGDFVSSLAQMGIKIVTDEGAENHGQFAIAPHGLTTEMQAIDQELFDNAIENNLEDVIAFFSNDGVGTSSSANFRYVNHIDGMTDYGTYDVSYDIDATGNITNVMIGGSPASGSDLNPNTFTVGGDGPAAGMSITVDNLTEGSYTGTVSLQQGKVGQLEEFFAAELKYYPASPTDPSLGADNGGLMIAQNGYQELIDTLDTRIEWEMNRLDRWEETQRMKFSRLDTLLGDYNGKMEVLNQQLAQLA